MYGEMLEAVLNDDITQCALLISAGVDLKIGGSDYMQVALARGNQTIAEMLLDNGLDPNTHDSLGFYLIHSAVLKAAPWAIDMLVKYGADVNARRTSSRSETALDIACGQNDSMVNQEIVKKLISHGADPFLQDDWGLTAFTRSKQFGLDSLHDILMTYKPKGDNSVH